MGAFIVAALIVVVTLIGSVFSLFAESMGDTTGQAGAPITRVVFLVGMSLAALVLGSHWLPSVGW